MVNERERDWYKERWNIGWEGIEYFIGVPQGSNRAVGGETIFEEMRIV